MRTWIRPHATGIACGLIGTDSVSDSGDLCRWHSRYRVLVAWWLDDIEHRFPQENPERFRTFLVRPHSRNRLKLELQDDFDQEISGRKTMTITHIGRVRVSHSYRVPERFVCHPTTSHVAITVRQ